MKIKSIVVAALLFGCQGKNKDEVVAICPATPPTEQACKEFTDKISLSLVEQLEACKNSLVPRKKH